MILLRLLRHRLIPFFSSFTALGSAMFWTLTALIGAVFMLFLRRDCLWSTASARIDTLAAICYMAICAFLSKSAALPSLSTRDLPTWKISQSSSDYGSLFPYGACLLILTQLLLAFGVRCAPFFCSTARAMWVVPLAAMCPTPEFSVTPSPTKKKREEGRDQTNEKGEAHLWPRRDQ